MRGPRIDHYNAMEEVVLESPTFTSAMQEIGFHLHHAMRDARADGYEQALRDLRALALDDDVICLIPDDIDAYAAERGIDLEAKP